MLPHMAGVLSVFVEGFHGALMNRGSFSAYRSASALSVFCLLYFLMLHVEGSLPQRSHILKLRGKEAAEC